jgi:hypothetical protein
MGQYYGLETFYFSSTSDISGTNDAEVQCSGELGGAGPAIL